MKLASRTAAVFFFLGTFVWAWSTEVIYEQPGQTSAITTGVTSNKVDAIFEESQAWDNFVITQPVEITGVSWTGQYLDAFNPNAELRANSDFLVQFTPNLPGNSPDIAESSQIAEFLIEGGQSGLNEGSDVVKTLIPDQMQQDGGSVFRYDAEVDPFTLEPGTYWISIQAQLMFLSNENPEWTWVLGTEGDSLLYSYDEAFDTPGSQPGLPFTRDTAFSLIGNEFLAGDFDTNGALEAADIDLLADAIRNATMDLKYDVNGDGSVTEADHLFWVETLKGTYPGDANLNLEVEFSDFLALSRNFDMEGGWAQGNFDLDTEVLFGDFLDLSRNFGKGEAVAAAVPEPHGISLLMMAMAGLLIVRRRR